MDGPRDSFTSSTEALGHRTAQMRLRASTARSSFVLCASRLVVALVLVGFSCCVSAATTLVSAAPMRLRGGSQLPAMTEEQMRRLPWYIILENSPLKLGDGPYGLPYVNGQVNPKNTLWAENPKLAMSKTLWNAAEDNATVEPVEKLLKIGADPNFQDPNTKCTPLHLAAMHGNTQLAVLLIQNGGDINKRCNKAGTPIEIAKSYNHEATVSAMLEAAASK